MENSVWLVKKIRRLVQQVKTNVQKDPSVLLSEMEVTDVCVHLEKLENSVKKVIYKRDWSLFIRSLIRIR